MADEAILRIVIVDEERSDSGGDPAPPDDGTPRDEFTSDAAVSNSLRSLRFTVDTLTVDLYKAAVAMRQIPYLTGKQSTPPPAPPPPKVPLAIGYTPPAPPPVAPAPKPEAPKGTPYERLQVLHAQSGKFTRQLDAINDDRNSSPGEKQQAREALYSKMEAWDAELKERREEVFNSAKLTEQERKLFDLATVHGMDGPQIGAELGVHKTRVSAIASRASKKMGIEESLNATLRQRQAENREAAERDQESAGESMDFAREATEKNKGFEVTPPGEKAAKSAAAQWLKEASKKKQDKEKLAELEALARAASSKAAEEATGVKHRVTGGWLDPEDNPDAFMDESDFDIPIPRDESDDPTEVPEHHAKGGIPALLGTPSPDFPTPPPGWTPDMMSMYPKDALKAVHGGDPSKVDLARQVAEYVYKYSLDPKNVYKRVLGNIGDRTDDVDMDSALAAAKKAAEMAAGYGPEYPEHHAEGGWIDIAKKHFPGVEKDDFGFGDEYADGTVYGRQLTLDHYKDRKLTGINFRFPDQPATAQNESPDADSFAFARAMIAYVKDLKAAGYGVLAEPAGDKRGEIYEKIFARLGMEKTGDFEHRAAGGRVDMSRGGPMPNTGVAKSGEDWHPAWLTNKEFVVNEQSAQRNAGPLAAANANPDVKLQATHLAFGGQIPFMARQASAAAGAAGVALPAGVGAALDIAGGPIGMLVTEGAKLVGQAEKEFQESMVGAVKSVGAFTASLANPDADPSKLFTGAGDFLISYGEKVSKGLNSALGPLPGMLGIDLFPAIKLVSGVAGEAAKQFGALMQAVDATAKRYGEFSADVAVAEAMVEIKHTMGELRRAQESGPELARYLRAQGDLQQKVEDIKIKLLTKLLPLITTIVNLAEKVMPAGENIEMAISALLAPLTLAVEGVNRIAFAQEDANRPEVADPTDVLFQNPGAMQGQGVGVPQV